MAVITSDEPYFSSWSAPGPPKNAQQQAAQSMMQAGIGSLSGNKYDGMASQMTTSPAGNNYYHPNFNVVSSNLTEKIKHKNNNASGMSYSISDFVNPNTGNVMSMSEASNAFAPFRESSRFVYPDGSGYEERGGNTYPIQLKGPQTWRINPGDRYDTGINKFYIDKIIRDNPEAIYDWYEWNVPLSEEEMEWQSAPIDRHNLPYGGPAIDQFIEANPGATNEDLWNFLNSLPPGLIPGDWYDFGDEDMGASI